MEKIAEFQQLSNDMYWTWWHSEFIGGEHHFEKVRWIGYNDSHWWNNISKLHSVRECSCGKKFAIDYETNEVKEIEV